MPLNRLITFFRIIALLEGASYIALLLAMPLKYCYGNEYFVKILGLPHGLLFIAYIILGFIVNKKKFWIGKDFIILISASVVPFGTFYIDRKYLKNLLQ
tara:strand:- start:385 stop:681 length:297 start_codon:yes stop_codon:yes gene_type:complete